MKRVISLLLSLLILFVPTNKLIASENINYTGFDQYLKKLDVESKFKGALKDNSIILLQVDKLTNFFIDKKYKDEFIMPKLKKLLNDDQKNGLIYFNNYFEDSIAKSSELDFSTLNSLYPHPNVNSIDRNKNNFTFELPKILNDLNYETSFLHVSKIYNPEKLSGASSMGFKRISYLGGENDKVFEKIYEYMKDNKKKFIYANTDLNSNYSVSDDLNIEEISRLNNEISYLRYIDDKINELIKRINESEKKYTLIIIGTNGDSSEDPNIVNKNSKFYENYEFKDELNMTFIIKTNLKDDNIIIDSLCSSIDIMPTILHLIDANINTFPMMGEVLLKSNIGDRVIAFQNQLKKGSFYDGKTFFIVNKINKEYKIQNIGNKKSDNINELRLKSKEVIKNINMSNGLCDLNILKEISNNYVKKINMNLEPNKTIMHAGGAVNGISYSNLKETLDYSYAKGKRFFEIDFEKTSDNKYVGLHSWDGFIKKFFDVDPVKDKDGNKKAFSYEKFMNFNEVHGYTQMDVKIAMDWLQSHNDAYIITDCKGSNVDLLKEIKSVYTGDLSKVIVQIYGIDEYKIVKSMGFKNIIFTLYRTNLKEDEIIEFAKKNKLYAITINGNRFKNGFGKKIIKNGIKVFVHTINSVDDANKLFNDGVSVIYTDIL